MIPSKTTRKPASLAAPRFLLYLLKRRDIGRSDMGDLANLTRWEPFADGSADTLNSDILVSISSLVVTIAVLYLTPDGASCTVR